MSLDLKLIAPMRIVACVCPQCGNSHKREQRDYLFETNITHNLSLMFDEVGAYDILWHGGGKRAGDVLPALRDALRLMEQSADRLHAFDTPGGWGTYEQALPWFREVVAAFEANVDGELRCSI